MNQYELAIAALLGLQTITMIVLWRCHAEKEWFRKAWIRESTELLNWKRNGIMRDKRTGRYHKRGQD